MKHNYEWIEIIAKKLNLAKPIRVKTNTFPVI